MTKEAEISALIRSIPVEALAREREFMENLFVGRFNYFLVMFTLFMNAGFANTILPEAKSLVFYIGAGVLFLVWLALFRGYKKHDRIMKVIFQARPEHPANMIEHLMRLDGYQPKYRVSVLMGITIPWVCIGTLLAIALTITHKLL